MRFHVGAHSGLRLYKKEEPGLKRWKKLMAPVELFTGQSTQSNPTNFIGLLCLIIIIINIYKSILYLFFKKLTNIICAVI